MAVKGIVDGRQLPTHIEIGHLRYMAVRDNATIDAENTKDRRSYAGFSNVCDQRIAVREDLGDDAEAETVLHEVLHQCLAVAGFDADHFAKSGVEDMEERTVTAMAGMLLLTLRRNPALVTYLIA